MVVGRDYGGEEAKNNNKTGAVRCQMPGEETTRTFRFVRPVAKFCDSSIYRGEVAGQPISFHGYGQKPLPTPNPTSAEHPSTPKLHRCVHKCL
ncbi:hypothetical protein CEXT_510341 [Caerostris extrusa]|uniref:Uncharacterized protein n=1 Tax=Caerostris extrusa TaxID=172846 RepID=A0AAV4NU68_CAEEX|nr:hypothetical protein CEXT_510341 [Caerostris extrusa]